MSKSTTEMDDSKASQAQESLNKFNAWVATQTDDDFRVIARGAKLHRGEVAAGCGFKSRSTLNDNLLVQAALKELETELRQRNKGEKPILARLVDGAEVAGGSDEILYDQSSDSVKKMRQELDRLQKSNIEKDAVIRRLSGELEYYTEIAKVLSGTGIMRR